MVSIGQPTSEVLCYEDVFKIVESGVVSKVKMKVIQEMIQVERPVNWSIENVKKIINEIKNIELYNSVIIGKLEEVKEKWKIVGNCT